MGAACGGAGLFGPNGSRVIMAGFWGACIWVTSCRLTCLQVAIGKMFEMFIVHDHADLRLLKVCVQTCAC